MPISYKYTPKRAQHNSHDSKVAHNIFKCKLIMSHILQKLILGMNSYKNIHILDKHDKFNFIYLTHLNKASNFKFWIEVGGKR